jgi:hypothetical protein
MDEGTGEKSPERLIVELQLEHAESAKRTLRLSPHGGFPQSLT